MDIGSIINNALGGLIGSLAFLLLVNMAKQIQIKLKQRTKQPREVLDEALLHTEEYKDILRVRKTHRGFGYMWIFPAIFLLSAYIALIVYTKKFILDFSYDTVIVLVLCLIPLELSLGYAPITSQEVEQKRQKNRERIFKEAHGAIPYKYIFNEIIFQTFFLLYFIFCIVGLILILTSVLPYLHIDISIVWKFLIIGIVILLGLRTAYFQLILIYQSIKHLKRIPRQQQRLLQQQFIKDEFER